jgi:16S rRNA (guanine527-N7)-methyltransferase
MTAGSKAGALGGSVAGAGRAEAGGGDQVSAGPPVAPAEVVEGRAEEVAHDPRRREAYDLAVPRAVAPLPVLLEYSLPFLCLGGHLAAAKGSAATSELSHSQRALRELGGELLPSLELRPPGGLAQSIVVVRKVAPTPARYPRRAGIPAKRPLL